MAEQEQVETVSSETQEAPEESLDDVLKDFPIEDAAKSFSAQPSQREPEVPEVNIPDPSYDPEGFKKAMTGMVTNDRKIEQTLNQVSEQLKGLEQQRARAIEDEDIASTVEKIQESVPQLQGKDRLVKGYLGAMASEDQRITRVWEQRKQNPAAWNRTLNAITKQLAKDFEFTADPQLTQDTRAMKASRDQMATTKQEDPNDKFKSMKPGEFDQFWQNLVNS